MIFSVIQAIQSFSDTTDKLNQCIDEDNNFVYSYDPIGKERGTIFVDRESYIRNDYLNAKRLAVDDFLSEEYIKNFGSPPFNLVVLDNIENTFDLIDYYFHFSI